MDKKTSDGLRMRASSGRSKIPSRASLSLALFTAMLLSFENMIGLSVWLPALLLGAGIALSVSLPDGNKRILTGMVLAAVGVAAALCAFVPGIAEGAKIVCNRLYDASEAVNNYSYERFPIALESVEALQSERAFRLLLASAGGLLAAATVRSRICAFLTLASCVAVEVYFGVVPETWRNPVLFFALALALMQADGAIGRTRIVVLLAGFLCVCLAVALITPGVDAALEADSERLRDFLAEHLHGGSVSAVLPSDDFNLTRRESQLSDAQAEENGGEAQGYRDYERRLAYREDISNPNPVDYGRIVLLLLLVAALFVVPFLPFYLLDRQKRRARAGRTDFQSPDCALAIRAMFPHIVRCLAALGLPDRNEDYIAFAKDVRELLSSEYGQEYQNAAMLWQEAAYSDHEMTEEQRRTVSELLVKTERAVYARVGAGKRFRLKYVDCLIVSEVVS